MSGSKSKIAVTLLGALAFGANAQAMNLGVKDDKPRQTLGAVREAAPQVKKGMPLTAKVVAGTFGTLAGLEFIRNMIGGFTNYKLGSYTIGRVIRNRVKKNEQPDLGEQDNKNPNVQNNEEKNEEIKSILPNHEPNTNIVSPENRLRSINFMNKMVNKMPEDIQHLGKNVVEYLSKVKVPEIIKTTCGIALRHISTGSGVITKCNYFKYSDVWCFGIEVTCHKDNADQKFYVYLAPGMKTVKGDYDVMSGASLYFQNGLVERWPCDNFFGYFFPS